MNEITQQVVKLCKESDQQTLDEVIYHLVQMRWQERKTELVLGDTESPLAFVIPTEDRYSLTNNQEESLEDVSKMFLDLEQRLNDE